VFGVSSNYLDVCYSQYFFPTEFGEGVSRDNLFSDINAARVLPIQKPKLDIVVGPAVQRATVHSFPSVTAQGLKDSMSISTKEPPYLLTAFRRNNPRKDSWRYWLAEVSSMAAKVPGFFFSSFAVIAVRPTVLVGMNTIQNILEMGSESVGLPQNTTGFVPPKQRLMVRLKDGVTELEREKVVNGMRPFINDDTTITIDVVAAAETASDTVGLLMIFFYVVSAVGSTLCFFIMWSSFDSNVRDNLWEFGVLRSIGLTSRQLTRVFIYESLSMIGASLLSGTAIGLTVAITLTVQQGLFTEMPFHFIFPSGLYGFIVATSIFVAMLGAYLPTRTQRNRPIAVVLRGK